MANKHVKRLILCEACQKRYDRWDKDYKRLNNNEVDESGELPTIRQVHDLLDTFMRHYKQCEVCKANNE